MELDNAWRPRPHVRCLNSDSRHHDVEILKQAAKLRCLISQLRSDPVLPPLYGNRGLRVSTANDETLRGALEDGTIFIFQKDSLVLRVLFDFRSVSYCYSRHYGKNRQH